MSGLLRRVIFYVLLVLIWAAVSKAGIWPPYLFPSPSAVWDTFVFGLRDGSFGIGLWMSRQRILIGYFISLIFGIGLGLLVGRFKILDETVGSLMTALQVLPSICWLPLAILWFGLNEWAIQFVVVMTPHPGRVKAEVPIKLVRPRDPLSVEFLDFQKQLLRELGQQMEAAS